MLFDKKTSKLSQEKKAKIGFTSLRASRYYKHVYYNPKYQYKDNFGKPITFTSHLYALYKYILELNNLSKSSKTDKAHIAMVGIYSFL